MDLKELPTPVQEAIELFKASPVGQQLAIHEKRKGRCKEASLRFIAALRFTGADGKLLDWDWPEKGSFHYVVQLCDPETITVDWTASQFETHPQAIKTTPWPRVETRQEAEKRWGKPVKISDEELRFVRLEEPEIPTWEKAQKGLPPRDS